MQEVWRMCPRNRAYGISVNYINVLDYMRAMLYASLKVGKLRLYT
jgi:hypothetical protein